MDIFAAVITVVVVAAKFTWATIIGVAVVVLAAAALATVALRAQTNPCHGVDEMAEQSLKSACPQG